MADVIDDDDDEEREEDGVEEKEPDIVLKEVKEEKERESGEELDGEVADRHIRTTRTAPCAEREVRKDWKELVPPKRRPTREAMRWRVDGFPRVEPVDDDVEETPDDGAEDECGDVPVCCEFHATYCTVSC